MKTIIKPSLFILTIAISLSMVLVSCSHQASQERSVAAESSKSCWDSVRGEYHSYFDSVEKCIEKEDHK